jgi:hypothetical protein
MLPAFAKLLVEQAYALHGKAKTRCCGQPSPLCYCNRSHTARSLTLTLTCNVIRTRLINRVNWRLTSARRS